MLSCGLHISNARQHIVEYYLCYDIPSARRWPRSADPTARSSWALSQPPQGRGGRAFAWIRCAAKSTKEATPGARGAKRRGERCKAQELLDRPVPGVSKDEVAPPSNRKGSGEVILFPPPLPRGTHEMCHGGRAAAPAEEQCPPRAKGRKEHEFVAKASAALGGEGCGKGSCGSYRVVTPL